MTKHKAIVVPAFNEARNLGQVIRSLRQAGPEDATIIVIDDGSSDQTADIAREHGVTLLQHRHNKGLGVAFRTAVEYCLRADVACMVFFDADNQFKAEEISRLMAPILDGTADCVLGSRFINDVPKDIPYAKLIGNRALAWFITLVTGKKLHDVSCGFRAYGREALLRINTVSDFTYTQEVILDLLFKKMTIVEIPIAARYFKDRTSSISSNLWRYGWRVFKIIARVIRDYRPMVFFGTVGAAVFIVGLVLDIWMLDYYFRTGLFSPYKIVGFGGAFLNFLGITIGFIGMVADMLNRVRMSQDEALYVLKKMNCRDE